MLDGYGLHTIIWDSADERLGDFLVASPADATGRGLELHVRQGGAAADLTSADVYFLWRHKATGERGCEPMDEIDESLGQYVVYYPAAMQEAEGAVLAQFMVSRGDDTYISSRVFTIRVEPVLVGAPSTRTDSRCSSRPSTRTSMPPRSRPPRPPRQTRRPRQRRTRRTAPRPSPTRFSRQRRVVTTTARTGRTAFLPRPP